MGTNEDDAPEGIKVGGCVVSGRLFEFEKEKGVAFRWGQAVYYDRKTNEVVDRVEDAKGKPNIYIGKAAKDSGGEMPDVLVATPSTGWEELPKPHVFDDDDEGDDGLVTQDLKDIVAAFVALRDWDPETTAAAHGRLQALTRLADIMASAVCTDGADPIQSDYSVDDSTGPHTDEAD